MVTIPSVVGLQYSRLEVEQAKLKDLKPKPAVSDLVFGKIFTDHMLSIDWDDKQGWHAPQIGPFKNLSMHPGAKVLHYAQELFEGMKAYRWTETGKSSHTADAVRAAGLTDLKRERMRGRK